MKIETIKEVVSSQSSIETAKIVNSNAVIEQLPIGVFVCTRSQSGIIQVLSINNFALSIFDAPSESKTPCNLLDLCGKAAYEKLAPHIEQSFLQNREYNIDWSLKNGSVERFISSKLIPLQDGNNQVYQVICTIEDKTAEKLAEKNLLHYAYHDDLTGLPNRALFISKLEDAVSVLQEDKSGANCAVLILNLDRFQRINQTFGHSNGDHFLVSITSTLQRCIKADDTLARLSGDEFAILVPKIDSKEDITLLADRIHQAMKMPYDLNNTEVFVTVSIGISTSELSNPHPEDLIRDADIAMHQAKGMGKSRSKIHASKTRQKGRDQFHLETELRRAVDNGDFELHYQPIIDLQNHKLKGFEALSRWKHKERGFISPAEFIPLAEETGIIVQLGDWAMKRACQQLKFWNDISTTSLTVNVNVSGVQFSNISVPDLISKALDASGAKAENLTLELTESAIISNPRKISQDLQIIRDKGIKVALDDFGTGYSSLNYLHQFPIDCIKIDRSFIVQMVRGGQKFEILNLIATFGKSMGLSLVAEGLEDIEHIKMLQEIDVDFAQGYYYSKPLTTDDATQLVQGKAPWTIPE